MPKFGKAQHTMTPPRGGRIRRVAWRIGWVLLTAVSLILTYGLLVFVGR